MAIAHHISKTKSALIYSFGLTIISLILFKIFYPDTFQNILNEFSSVPVCLECSSYSNLNIPAIFTGLISLFGYLGFWYWAFLPRKKSPNFKKYALGFWLIIILVGVLIKFQFGCPGMQQSVQFLSVDQTSGDAKVYQKGANQTYSCQLSGNLAEDYSFCQQTIISGFHGQAIFANLSQDLCSKDQIESNGGDFIIQLQKSGRTVDCQFSCEL